LNKIVDGSAIIAEAPTSFKESIGKFNPRLFNVYEKKKNMAASMSNFNKKNRKSLLSSMALA
jgi:hypothetical protein